MDDGGSNLQMIEWEKLLPSLLVFSPRFDSTGFSSVLTLSLEVDFLRKFGYRKMEERLPEIPDYEVLEGIETRKMEDDVPEILDSDVPDEIETRNMEDDVPEIPDSDVPDEIETQSPRASETCILGKMREFYTFDDPPCNISPPEIDLAEDCSVNVGHPKIGDKTHKPKAYLCGIEDLQFAAKVREISNWEDLNAALGERLGLFQIYVKSNSDALLVERINDVIKFCNRKKYDNRKLYYAVMISVNTHEYFVSSLRRTPMETYAFFRELILCHTNEEPPFSYEVFSPEEASELLLDFCKSYLRNLPLIRQFCLPSFALRISTMVAVKDSNVEDVPCGAAESDNATSQVLPEDSNKR